MVEYILGSYIYGSVKFMKTLRYVGHGFAKRQINRFMVEYILGSYIYGKGANDGKYT